MNGRSLINRIVLGASMAMACAGSANAEPSIWPKVKSSIGTDADLEAKITAIISDMSLRESRPVDHGRNQSNFAKRCEA